MTTRTTPLQQAKQYLRALREYRWLWIVPTVACTVAAGGYAALRPATWKAQQAIVVREEAAGGLSHQGRFDSTEAMKAFQETILELARNRTAVTAALESLGPPAHQAGKPWPSTSAIESLQDSIRVSAPRGGEFGKTEVIYLSVTGRTKSEALERTEAVYQQLEARLADLRSTKSSSLVVETSDRLRLAQAGLDEATTRLEAMEREVGSDLGELRILNDSGAGDSNLRASLNQLKQELRQARAAAEANEQQERMLVAANEDPENLLATSSRLFDAQPTLRRLNEGLLDAQLRSAELQGKMTTDHPLVQSALQTEAQVQRDLYAELSTALRGVRSDLEVNRQQVETLERQHEATQERLLRLASMRARYGNMVSELKQRSDLVEKAQQELSAARASLAGAESASLITRFDTPVVGSSPVGPGRSTILAAGMFGGLLAGLGLVFLAMPGEGGERRAWSNYLGYGRRASDRQGGRRGADAKLPPSAAAPAENPPRRRATDLPEPTARGRRGEDRAPAASAGQVPLAQRSVALAAAITERRAAAGNIPSTPVVPLAEVPPAPPTFTNIQPESTPEAAVQPAVIASAPTARQSAPAAELGNSGKTGSARRSLLATCLTDLDQS